MEQSLKEILDNCKEGDRDSQRTLFFRYYRLVYNTVRKYLESKEEAEECSNDVFLKLFASVDKYSFKTPFEAWLRRVAINYSIDQLRKKKKKIRGGMSLTGVNIGQENLLFQDLIKVINCLPRQYKLVFLLVVVDGYSHKEVGNLLGISVGTSKSNLSKAKKKLRSIISQNEKILNG